MILFKLKDGGLVGLPVGDILRIFQRDADTCEIFYRTRVLFGCVEETMLVLGDLEDLMYKAGMLGRRSY